MIHTEHRVPAMQRVELSTVEIKAEVMREVVEHLRDGARSIPSYVDAYIASSLSNPARASANRPIELHPILATFAREIVWDVLTSAPLDTVKR